MPSQETTMPQPEIKSPLRSDLSGLEPLTNAAGFWYLASPYTHTSANKRAERAYDVQNVSARLLSKRINVYSPIWATHEAACDHALPTDHLFWLEFNKVFIDPAAGMVVVMLDGWQSSAGIRQEIEYARQCGKPVYFLDPKTLALIADAV